ncbi:MAG: PspC domain-containing protein, partial [Chloroflexales bacterium]
PRLTRSTSETMVAGICGGIAQYFSLDPVIVRLIFVIVTLTSGFGIPVYIVLWIIMPKGNQSIQGQQHLAQSAKPCSQAAAHLEREVLVGQRPGQVQSRNGGLAGMSPTPPVYHFDLPTGEPLSPDSPQTATLPPLPLGQPDQATQPVPQRVRNWNTLGLILISVGVLVLLEQLGINMSPIFSTLLVVAGVILIRRKR